MKAQNNFKDILDSFVELKALLVEQAKEQNSFEVIRVLTINAQY